MPAMFTFLLVAAAAPLISASPVAEAEPAAIAIANAQPVATASPVAWDPTKTAKHRRDVGDSINSLLGGFPSYVASGVPNFFQDFPQGDKVASSLGLSESAIQSLPTQVINVP